MPPAAAADSSPPQWQSDVLSSVKLACVSVGVGAASYSICAQLRLGSVTVRPAAFLGRPHPDSLLRSIDGRCSRRWLSRWRISRGLDADVRWPIRSVSSVAAAALVQSQELPCARCAPGLRCCARDGLTDACALAGRCHCSRARSCAHFAGGAQRLSHAACGVWPRKAAVGLQPGMFGSKCSRGFLGHAVRRPPLGTRTSRLGRGCLHVSDVVIRSGHRVHRAVPIFPAANDFSPGRRC